MTAGDFARVCGWAWPPQGSPLGVEGIPWPTANERSGASVLEAQPARGGGQRGPGRPGAKDAPERQGRPSLARPGLLAGGRVRTWAIEAPSGSKKRLRWRGPPEVLTRAGARSQPFHDGGRGVPAEHAAGSLRVAMEVAWAAFSSETWGLSPAHVILGRGQFPGTLGLRSFFSCRATWCPPRPVLASSISPCRKGPFAVRGSPEEATPSRTLSLWRNSAG
ncbi:unnamed protein product [Nyctereutes procyonoides]|uniref:(raccoon dog) hypothetical protein n=1 Tax=Nyctereutes procyonoides TaxID=34880 RepID=A0A811Z2J2_NYCPR|nr:unnamed protein product [Nyctereutes procyonoides]